MVIIEIKYNFILDIIIIEDKIIIKRDREFGVVNVTMNIRNLW